MVSLRSVSLEIVVQQRICLLHSFSRQACASLLRPLGALGSGASQALAYLPESPGE